MNTRSTALRAIALACLLTPATAVADPVDLLAGDVVINGGTTVNVPGSQASPWTINATLFVGDSSQGTLNIIGGVVNSNSSVIGNTATGEGAVTVSGKGAVWTAAKGSSGRLTVGSAGKASLTIQAGGRVEATGNASVNLGLAPSTSTGLVTITGQGSTLSVSNALGIAGGALRVENGGTLAAQTASLANSGTLLVTGSGSSLTLGNNIFISNNATFTLADGGGAKTFRGWIGDSASAGTSSVIVKEGATWTLDEKLSPRPDTHSILTVGRRAHGELLIESGGKVTGLRATIGGERETAVTDVTGVATVTGPGSLLKMDQDISVGDLGTGTLSILQGGNVISGTGVIGATATAKGAMSVSGAGSLWGITGTLTNGVAGSGTLSIADGGRVTATRDITNDGSITLQGNASSLATDGALVIGSTKTAELTADGGATISSKQGKLGSTAAGSAALSGGARWDVTDNLWVGESARGTLSLSSGAQLTSGSINDQMGRNASALNSIITLTGKDPVSGTPTKWTRGSQPLYMGLAGGGNRIEIRDGAQLMSAGQVALNFQAGGTGNTLLVSGEGSLFHTDRDLTIGYLGRDNALIVEAGAKAEAATGQIGGSTSVNNTGRVSGRSAGGTASAWEIGGQLFVGNTASSGNRLEVLGGGQVRARQASIGAGAASANNAVVVEGAGSLLAVGKLASADPRSFVVGDSASGSSLTVSGGGAAEAHGGLTIGRQLGANANRVTLTDEGSRLVVENGFAVGRNGAGNTAAVSGGALLDTTGSAWIGAASGSPATGNSVSVDGATSRWHLGGDLNIGSALAPLSDGVEDTPLPVTPAAAAGNTLRISGGARVSQTGGATVIGGGGNLLDVGAASAFSTDGAVSLGSGSRLSLGPSARVSGGGFAMAAGSQLDVFAQEGNSSLLSFGGTAALGGTLSALIDGRSSLTHRFLVLEADTVQGRFDSAVLNDYSANLDWLVLYTPQDVFLQLDAVIEDVDGLNENQSNVAESLDDFFNRGGALPPSFIPILNLTGDRLGQALSQLSGEVGASGGAAAAASANTSFLRSMLDHATPDCDRRRADDPQKRCEHAAWAAGFGSTAKLPGNDVKGSHDTTATTTGIATGWDYARGDVRVGVALAGGGTGWDLDGSGMGSGDATFLQLGAYGTRQLGRAYASLAGAYALQAMNTTRRVTALESETLDADLIANALAGRGEAGYRFGAADGLGLTPYAALQGQAIRLPGYDESGTLGSGTYALSFNDTTTTAVRSELGLGLDLSGDAAQFTARAAWAHDWLNDAYARAGFQSLPGTRFIVNGAEAPANLALVSLSADVEVARNTSLTARLDGEFGDRYQSYAGTLALTYAW